MKQLLKAQGLLSLGLLLLLLPLSASAQDHITAAAAPDRPAITFAESVRITLTITGPAPLRVDVPPKVLVPQSAQVWEISPDVPAKIEPLPNGREKWTQVFRLKPWIAGEKVPLAFAPFKVAAGPDLNPQEVAWPTLTIAVDAGMWKKATVDDLEAARNRVKVSGIEELPAPFVEPPERIGWLIAGGTSLLFVVAVLVALRRRRSRVPPLPPLEWVSAEFDRLERDGCAGRDFADRLAAILREFVERRFGLMATRLTTAELFDECKCADWLIDSTAGLRDLLDRCDRAKFAGDVPDASETASLLARARAWVAITRSPAAVGGQ